MSCLSGLSLPGCAKKPFPVQGMGTNLSSALVIKAKAYRLRLRAKGYSRVAFPSGLDVDMWQDSLRTALFTPHTAGSEQRPGMRVSDEQATREDETQSPGLKCQMKQVRALSAQP